MFLFIRHAEKVLSEPVHLSILGYKRSMLLPDYIEHSQDLFKCPTAIFAMANHRHGSHRCVETVYWIATSLQLPIQTYKNWKTMLKKAHREKCALICWEHKEIPKMLQYLGFHNVRSWGLYPKDEKDMKYCFDATWVMDNNKLIIYRQFSINDYGEAIWIYPRIVPTSILYKTRSEPFYCRLISFCFPYIIRI